MIRQLFKRKLNQFFNRRGQEPMPVRFDWRRIYVLPSKAGIFFAAIWFLMMLAGLNFNNNMSLMLVFLLFGLAQVILHKTFFNIKDLKLEQATADPVFLGDELTLNLKISAPNNKWQIRTENELSSDVGDLLDNTTHLKSLLPSKQRGWQTLERIKFYSNYPLGLFTVWVYCIPDATVLVYPKPESPCPPFPTHGGQEGEKNTLNKGEELSDIREYRQGDPVRDIAWKKSAQSTQTWVKQFHQTQGKHLLFDFSQIKRGGLEFKLSRLTAWVIEAHNTQVEYQLKLPGFDSDMSSGAPHKHQCLKQLALFQTGGESSPV